MQMLPVIVVRCACTSVRHVCAIQDEEGVFVRPCLCVSLSSHFFLVPERREKGCGGRGGKLGENARLILPPPPRHWPACTITERPPSAAHGRLTCSRTVREPGAMCQIQRAGCLYAGSFCVVRPASSTRIRRSGSAIARRLAIMQPAVPPIARPLYQKREDEGGRGRTIAHRPR